MIFIRKNKEMLKKWSKAKRRQACMCHFGSDDIVIDDYRFNNVHELPNEWNEHQEVDFYVDTHIDIYLVRIINNHKNTITFIDDGMITDIVIEKPMSNNIMYELKNIVSALKAVNIPTQIKRPLCVAFPF
jgi:hypothetical protein